MLLRGACYFGSSCKVMIVFLCSWDISQDHCRIVPACTVWLSQMTQERDGPEMAITSQGAFNPLASSNVVCWNIHYFV